MILGTEKNLSASIRGGDLDGDGDTDLVVANGRHWPQQNYVFFNDGRGRFNVMRPLGEDRSTSYAAEIADLDGDGDLDIVTGNAMAPCHVFRNDGSGHFTSGLTLPIVSSVRSLTVGDVNGDRVSDVIATCRGRSNTIFFNDGAGRYSKTLPFGTGDDSTIGVAAADVNDDGIADLLLANRDGQSNLLMLGQKDATYRAVDLDNAKHDSRSVVTADFNGDGKLDCAFCNLGARNTVLFGDGEGNFTAGAEFGTATTDTYALAACDLDNDGDIDLVAGNVNQKNAVYFNTGEGLAFVEQTFGDATTATYGICTADLDGDQFVDIAVANSGSENRIYLNRAMKPRQPAGNVKPASSTSKVVDTDWPAFRGRGALGVAEGFSLPLTWNADPEDATSENVVWRKTIPGLGHSSPVVAGHKIFVATAVASEGEAPLQVGRGGAPDAADDHGIQQWLILCMDKRTGAELWRTTCHEGEPKATRHSKATHANTTLTIQGDRLIAFLGSEGLYCYNLEGELLWKRDLGTINISKYGIGWGYASSPAVHDDRIVLVCDDPENPFLVSLDLESGKELWRVARDNDCERNWSTPLIHVPQSDGTAQVIVNGWPCVVSYRLDDGKELWRIRGGGDNPVPTPFAIDERIFITSAHGDLSPIHVVHPSARGDLTELKETAPNSAFLWSVDRGGAYMSTPVVLGDYLYLGNSNGVIRCFHATTGERMYEERLGSRAGIIASLVAGDNKIYCASENGTVYVVKPGPTFELLAENPMGNPCFATPAISEGVLYFRTTTELMAVHD